MLADVHTPVGIYLRLRDRFRDTVLLESTDHHAAENSFSFIGIHAIAGIEIKNGKEVELKYPGEKPERVSTADKTLSAIVWDFMHRFNASGKGPEKFAQGLFGYTSFDAVQLFEKFPKGYHHKQLEDGDIPLMRYRLYQYVIAIDHFRDELYLLENQIQGLESDSTLVESLIRNRDVPIFPFTRKGEHVSNMSDSDFMRMVQKGINHCHRGDVFQIVLSRLYQQKFTGDDFNVYRALRTVNPSPYLFYFDYSDYHLMGSSPESQLLIKDQMVTVHPIAGTCIRTGDVELDEKNIQTLKSDAKENAEHVMLVDLARNDLSRIASEIKVAHFREVHQYSHVIHLVSEVTGKVSDTNNPFESLAATFPAGTLSGAPKIRAVQLIQEYEPTSRGFYGGCIGYAGFDGSFNHAIMIRSLMSKNNTLYMQAGAGIVAASQPENELQEVENKLKALRKAIELAETIC